LERYGDGTGTVWRKIGAAVWGGMGWLGLVYGSGMEQYWSGGMGSVWDDWVWYTGAVWEQYWSGDMGCGGKF